LAGVENEQRICTPSLSELKVRGTKNILLLLLAYCIHHFQICGAAVIYDY